MGAVPTWEEYMAPCLRVLSDSEVRRTRETVEGAADILGISDEQRQILIPSGAGAVGQSRQLGVFVSSTGRGSGAAEPREIPDH